MRKSLGLADLGFDVVVVAEQKALWKEQRCEKTEAQAAEIVLVHVDLVPTHWPTTFGMHIDLERKVEVLNLN